MDATAIGVLVTVPSPAPMAECPRLKVGLSSLLEPARA
jgi:hypothetical protein